MFFKTLLTIFGIFLLGGFIILRFTELVRKGDLTSPVLGVSKEQVSANVWSPKIDAIRNSDFSDAPEITALSALFVDTSTGQVLYAKNAEKQLSIASLTKIMTTIIALENNSLDDLMVVSQRASEMEPDEMILLPGEKHTLRNLLDGIFLVSANDAAEVIAENVTSRREEFIKLMNSKAIHLGMNNTIYVNPTGLEEDPKNCQGRIPCQYSTALDVVIMSRYLIRTWPEIINISSQPYVFIERTSEHQEYEMFTGINLLTTYPGVMGLKTGYTPKAGLTLVTLARQNNHEVLGVLLGAVNRRDDAKALLDYTFKKLDVEN